MAEPVGSAKARFDELDGARSSTLDRAILCSEYTIPYLFREESATDSDDLTRERVQGFGAKLVNHLVGKFALSILPPSQPFYRLSPTPEAMEAVSQDDETAKSEINRIIAKKEDEILRYINKSKFRSSLYPALRLAMVTGDALIESVKDGESYVVHNMRNYVIKRDSEGNIIELIVKESMDYASLPEDIRSTVDDKEEEFELYSRLWLDEDGINFRSEIDEEPVSGSDKTLKSIDDMFISIRWNIVDGEDYGRGYVEVYLGSFIELNNHLNIIAEGSALSARTIFTVNPNGMTKYKDFVEANNGDAIVGKDTDIGLVRTDKSAELQISYSIVNDLKRELSEAFLMSSASIRDAERVTAYEVQKVASELEASFGGIYTAIASDIQLPIVNKAMNKIKITSEQKKDIDVFIIAGVEALGRNSELAKIAGLVDELTRLAQLVGQEQVAKSLNTNSMVNSIVNNSGVAGRDFVFSKKEIDTMTAQSKEEMLAQEALMQGAGKAGQQAGQNIANQI